jgi:osmotically-inducible protein OsmY
MRTKGMMILAVLAQIFLVAGLSSARQNDSNQRFSRNSDGWLKQEVRHQLLMVPWYTVFDNLQYSVNGNVVTLSGEVTQPTLKSDAENAVKHIEGVDKVNNNIEVLPLSPTDDQIRRAEYHAIYSQDKLSRYGMGALQSIHIIVKNGHVTLEGVVDSQQDKDAAGIYAKGVPGVFSVDNNLSVTGSR